MNKTLKTFLLLIILIRILPAQYAGLTLEAWFSYPTNWKPNEYITQSWQNSDWQNNVKETSSYNDEGLLIEKITWGYNNEAWYEGTKYLYSYNETGLILEEINQGLNQDDKWVNSYRDTFYYDDAGNNIEKRHQTWGNEEWNERDRIKREFDANGNVLKETMQKWDVSWVNQKQYRYEYSGEMITSVYMYGWDNSHWVANLRWLYEYSGSKITQLYEQFNGNDWETRNNSRVTANYDGEKLINYSGEILEEIDKVLTWKKNVETIYSYNSYGPTNMIQYGWRWDDRDVWDVVWTENYSYTDSGQVSEILWEFDDGMMSGKLLANMDYDVNNNLIKTISQSLDDGQWSNHERQIYVYNNKTFKVVDAKGDSLANIEFKIYKVDDDPPTYTEHYIGSFTTDDSGKYQFEKDSEGYYVLNGQRINTGDKIKVSKYVHWKRASVHNSIEDTMYTLYLDNIKIDRYGAITIDEFNNNSKQKIKMDHSEVRFNLVVSVEWDAKLEYLNGLKNEIRKLSNYLYDVFDGQLRLDKVYIFDNKNYWKESDIQIRACNMQWPYAEILGINTAAPYHKTIVMPRKFFSKNYDANRNISYSAYPYNNSLKNNYRCLGHEFGHYAIGFFDEYEDINGKPCNHQNIGFMQQENSESDVYSSEMYTLSLQRHLQR